MRRLALRLAAAAMLLLLMLGAASAQPDAPPPLLDGVTRDHDVMRDHAQRLSARCPTPSRYPSYDELLQAGQRLSAAAASASADDAASGVAELLSLQAKRCFTDAMDLYLTRLSLYGVSEEERARQQSAEGQRELALALPFAEQALKGSPQYTAMPAGVARDEMLRDPALVDSAGAGAGAGGYDTLSPLPTRSTKTNTPAAPEHRDRDGPDDPYYDDAPPFDPGYEEADRAREAAAAGAGAGAGAGGEYPTIAGSAPLDAGAGAGAGAGPSTDWAPLPVSAFLPTAAELDASIEGMAQAAADTVQRHREILQSAGAGAGVGASVDASPEPAVAPSTSTGTSTSTSTGGGAPVWRAHPPSRWLSDPALRARTRAVYGAQLRVQGRELRP